MAKLPDLSHPARQRAPILASYRRVLFLHRQRIRFIPALLAAFLFLGVTLADPPASFAGPNSTSESAEQSNFTHCLGLSSTLDGESVFTRGARMTPGEPDSSGASFTASVKNSRTSLKHSKRNDFNNTLALTREASSFLPQLFFSQQKSRNHTPKSENFLHPAENCFQKVIAYCEIRSQHFTPVPFLVDKRAVVAQRPGSPRASPFILSL